MTGIVGGQIPYIQTGKQGRGFAHLYRLIVIDSVFMIQTCTREGIERYAGKDGSKDQVYGSLACEEG